VHDSPRWGGKKPNPFPGSNITLTGYLIGVARNEQGVIEYFEIELEKVTYHGKGSTGPSVSGSPGGQYIHIIPTLTKQLVMLILFFSCQYSREEENEIYI
jgi:hypothetical protein